MSPTIVLVHGGFVDGSGWRGVYDVLRADGFDVRVVQNPTKSLADDDATVRDVLDSIDEPVVLVGHSYGGAVITEAGTHDKVAALVYITAFAPDQGESVQSLISTFPADGPQPPILPPCNGYLFLDRAKFHEAFAADLTSDDAAFLADAQVPWGLGAPGKPTCRNRRCGDRRLLRRMIPPAAQASMAERTGATVVNTAGSHAIYVSQPKTVADLIRTAAAAIAWRSQGAWWACGSRCAAGDLSGSCQSCHEHLKFGAGGDRHLNAPLIVFRRRSRPRRSARSTSPVMLDSQHPAVPG